ncbi:MAG: S41 family peptidase [Candidatus Omnitrophica bacterium]|nr:S41 family peptidase [Candidatus Omnitrophota bacterium]
MKRSKLLIAIFIFISLTVTVTLSVSAFGKKDNKSNLYAQIELFSDAITYVMTNYVDEVNGKDLIYGALKGMLSSLDAHSQFLDPDSFKDIREDTKGEFGGLGIEISARDGLLTIISPLEGTPAYNAGVEPNDRIVKIDSVSTRNITLIDAVKKLRGKPGTDVTLTLLRESEGRIFDVLITRAVIKVEGVKEPQILEDGIGYIRIAEFQEKTPKDLDAALKKLKNERMSSLILDLRNNPGGLLDVAVSVSENFLDKGKLIVSTKGRMEEQGLQYTASKAAITDVPMIVLINGGSASASEIVAGAMQDNKRAVIMGTKSFGKGSVQTVIPLKDNSAIKLTTAKYFTPSGRAIKDEAITPDVIVEYRQLPAPDEALKKVEEVFKKVEGKEKNLENPEGIDVKNLRDNQLLRAMDLLKGIKFYSLPDKN